MEIVLSLVSEPHFHCPKGSEMRCFFGTLSERLPEYQLRPLFEVRCSISSRSWGALGVPWQAKFESFLELRFELKSGRRKTCGTY